MRISDWSSDVCSSDLYTQRFIFDDSDTRGELVALERSYAEVLAKHPYPEPVAQLLGELMAAAALLVGTLKFDGLLIQIGRASCRERGCLYVEIPVVAVSLKKKDDTN